MVKNHKGVGVLIAVSVAAVWACRVPCAWGQGAMGQGVMQITAAETAMVDPFVGQSGYSLDNPDPRVFAARNLDVVREFELDPTTMAPAPDSEYDLNHQGIWLPAQRFYVYLSRFPMYDPWKHQDKYKQMAQKWYHMVQRVVPDRPRGGAYEVLYWYDPTPAPLDYQLRLFVVDSRGLLVASVYVLEPKHRDFRLEELARLLGRSVLCKTSSEKDAQIQAYSTARTFAINEYKAYQTAQERVASQTTTLTKLQASYATAASKAEAQYNLWLTMDSAARAMDDADPNKVRKLADAAKQYQNYLNAAKAAQTLADSCEAARVLLEQYEEQAAAAKAKVDTARDAALVTLDVAVAIVGDIPEKTANVRFAEIELATFQAILAQAKIRVTEANAAVTAVKNGTTEQKLAANAALTDAKAALALAVSQVKAGEEGLSLAKEDLELAIKLKSMVNTLVAKVTADLISRTGG